MASASRRVATSSASPIASNRWRKRDAFAASPARPRWSVLLSLMPRSPSQHAQHALHAGGDGGVVVHERHADIALARVLAAGRARDIGAGQRAHARLAPQRLRRLLAIADIEPQEEPAGRAVEAEAPAERLLGAGEFAAIERPVRLAMRLVLPQLGGGVRQRQRALCAATAARMPAPVDQ